MNKFVVTVDDETYQVVVAPQGALTAWESAAEYPAAAECSSAAEPAATLQVQIDGRPARVTIPSAGLSGDEIDWVIVDGRPYEIGFDHRQHWVESANRRHRVQVRPSEVFITSPLSRDGLVSAPIPGRVLNVLVTEGECVEAGQPLVTLEAMKMENEIRALCPGVVQAIHIQPGQCVKRNEKLVEIA